MASQRHPITGQRLSQDQLDRLIDPHTGDWDWTKIHPDDSYDTSDWMSKEAYAHMMRDIRGRYAKYRKTMHDGAAFDTVVDDYEVAWHDRRKALRFTTKALVVGSAKAKLINTKYFKGRYK